MMTAEELEKTLEDLKQKVAKLEGGSFDSVEVRRKLVLREANGPIRAVLGLNDRGMVALGICDASGNPKLTLGVDDDDEPGISLSKGDSSTVLSVVVEDDEPRVCLYQGKRKRWAITVARESWRWGCLAFRPRRETSGFAHNRILGRPEFGPPGF